MTDRDVVVNVARIMKYDGVIGEYSRQNRKTLYVMQLYGNEAIQWMMTVYSLMGARRRAKILSILTLWKAYERRYKTHCVNGHEYTDDNTYIFRLLGRGPYRACMICRGEQQRAQDLKRKTHPEYKERRKLESKRWQEKLRSRKHAIKECSTISSHAGSTTWYA
jgi:hypothetical protein